MKHNMDAEKLTDRRWRHKKTGCTYREIRRGYLQVNGNLLDQNGFALDECEVVIYESEKDGSWWARPVHDFEDGRFEKVTPPPHISSETGVE